MLLYDKASICDPKKMICDSNSDLNGRYPFPKGNKSNNPVQVCNRLHADGYLISLNRAMEESTATEFSQRREHPEKVTLHPYFAGG